MRFDDQNGMCARFLGHGFQNQQMGIKLGKPEWYLEVFFGQNGNLHVSLWNIRVFVWKYGFTLRAPETINLQWGTKPEKNKCKIETKN
jgi:hypothetical protein